MAGGPQRLHSRRLFQAPAPFAVNFRVRVDVPSLTRPYSPCHSYDPCITRRSTTSMSSSKHAPVIVITGTPGTGKTTHAQLLVDESPISLKHINVGELVKEKGLYEEYDADWQSYTVDEDKVR